MTFSERHGFVAPRSALQKDSLDEPTRNRLINLAILVYLPRLTPFHLDEKGRVNFTRLIDEFFRNSIDKATEDYNTASRMLINWSANCEWYKLFDLLEFIANDDLDDDSNLGPMGSHFVAACDELFEQEKVAYRFIGNQIVAITDEQEVAAIEDALAVADIFGGARAHIRRALELYSDREKPDYRNAIKESISAVESVCKVISRKDTATLTDALKIIEKSHDMHPALKEALIKLYGYSSDKKGVRHALIQDSSIGHAEAKFMLVGCSAFCTYLIEQYGKI